MTTLVKSLTFGKDGDLFVGGYGNLFRLKTKREGIKHQESPYVWSPEPEIVEEIEEVNPDPRDPITGWECSDSRDNKGFLELIRGERVCTACTHLVAGCDLCERVEAP